MNSSRSNSLNRLLSSRSWSNVDDEVWLKVDGRLCDVSNLVGRPHHKGSFSSLPSSGAKPSSTKHRRSLSCAEPSLYPSTIEMSELFNKEEREQAQIKFAADTLARKRRSLLFGGHARSYSCIEGTSSHMSPKQLKSLLETEEQHEVEKPRCPEERQYVKSRSLGGGGFHDQGFAAAYQQDDSSLSSIGDDSFAQDTTPCTRAAAAISSTSPLSYRPQRRHHVEVTPGHSIPMLGSDETWQALQERNVRDVSCAACLAKLWVMKAATVVVCPTCRMLSPASTGMTEGKLREHVSQEQCLGLGILQSSNASASLLEQQLLRKSPPRKYASLYQDDDELGGASLHSTSSARAA